MTHSRKIFFIPSNNSCISGLCRGRSSKSTVHMCPRSPIVPIQRAGLRIICCRHSCVGTLASQDLLQSATPAHVCHVVLPQDAQGHLKHSGVRPVKSCLLFTGESPCLCSIEQDKLNKVLDPFQFSTIENGHCELNYSLWNVLDNLMPPLKYLSILIDIGIF